MFLLPSARGRNGFYVYKITNLVNGKLYIGKCVRTVHIRIYQHLHKRMENVNRPLYSAIRKYGADAFSVTVLKKCSSDAESYDVEKRLIATMKPSYNLTDGGRGRSGVPMTPEHKQKIINALRGHKFNVGKKRTPEQRRRFSEVQRAVRSDKKLASSKRTISVVNEKFSHPIWCLETGEFWNSHRDCARAHGKTLSAYVGHCVDKPTRTFCGKHFVSHVG